jgi:hypothetical protein
LKAHVDWTEEKINGHRIELTDSTTRLDTVMEGK